MANLAYIGIVMVGMFLLLVLVFSMNVTPEPATAVNGSGVVGATVDDKYAGLTDKEVQYVKIAKEHCDNNTALVSVQSETAGQLAAQRCLEQEQMRIDNYRAN